MASVAFTNAEALDACVEAQSADEHHTLEHDIQDLVTCLSIRSVCSRRVQLYPVFMSKREIRVH